ncbi:MAG TPA: hypothetical protein VEH29_11215 [Acidimicrobiales bacterium]|nr:hypothetical protein [Acidimicrobiales bacterium]
MSLENELRRQLHAKAAALRTAPDFPDLAGRIAARDGRVRRHERMALGAAVIVLAASLGGLAGALVGSPRAKQSNGQYTRSFPEQVRPGPRQGATSQPATGNLAPEGPRTIISRQAPGGVSVVATVQPFSSPVAISSEWSPGSLCVTGEIVSTTVGETGSFGGGTSVAQLPMLTSSGLEVLSSGVLPVAGGGQEWWVTAAVGRGVARVAAENVGGTPVTVTPSSAGIAVVTGSMSGPDTNSGEMSAVAEGAGGDASLGFLLGSGPRAVGESPAGSDASGCSSLVPQAGPSSASSSQPAEPELAAGSIIAAFDQAFSANPLLGFAANLAAVEDGDRLGAAPASKDAARQEVTGSAAVSGEAATAGGTVEVRQVTFLSASDAEVVYRLNDGVLLTGLAELGSGIWRVSLGTFCDSLSSRLIEGDVPLSVVSACEPR